MVGGCRRQVDIRPEVLNVDGEVDVLREAVNQPMGLGERGAALEGEALQELLICAKDLQGPDHPDVLLKQKGRPAGFGSSHRQGFLLILYGKSEPGLSHEPPAVPDLLQILIVQGVDISPYLQFSRFTLFAVQFRYDDEPEPLDLDRHNWLADVQARLRDYGFFLQPFAAPGA